MPGSERITYCISCGEPTPVVGVGAFRTCDACAAKAQQRAAGAQGPSEPTPTEGGLEQAARATLAALRAAGLDRDADALERSITKAAAARLEDVRAVNARRAYAQRHAARTAALQRITDAALAAATEQWVREHDADPDLWRAEWGFPMDVRQGGALNAVDVARDPASNLGRITVAFERTRR